MHVAPHASLATGLLVKFIANCCLNWCRTCCFYVYCNCWHPFNVYFILSANFITTLLFSLFCTPSLGTCKSTNTLVCSTIMIVDSADSNASYFHQCQPADIFHKSLGQFPEPSRSIPAQQITAGTS